MGQAKIRRMEGFSPQLINEWEADDCVNFAVALARMTGWLLHVDWWSPATRLNEDIPLDHLTPLRLYVADNSDKIFDVHGIKMFDEFTKRTVLPLALKVARGRGGILTRFYDEAKLNSLPLRSQPDETKIAQAIEAIAAKPNYLASIPKRSQPCIPAYEAARYTFGRCAVFAEAMRELTGLQPVALLAIKFSPKFEGTKRGDDGYFHSVVIHPDGMAEDAWGKASIYEIASRFGVIEFQANAENHRKGVEKIQSESAEFYDYEFNRAMALIRTFRSI